MVSVKRVTALMVSVMIFAVSVVSCSGNSAGGSAAGSAVARAEAVMQEELSAGLPDFSCPPVEDNSVKVEGMPEDVVWITSHPKDIASKDAKVGGTFHSFIPEFPTTYRTVGPESNTATRKYFLQEYTPTSLVDVMWETKEFRPGTATHWAFGADRQTVYYKLNENVKWSDGVPCTADDYVFMWKDFMLSPNLNAPWYKNYWEKREIKKINDYCISVKFLESDQLDKNTLLAYTSPMPRPKHFYNGELKENWFVDYNWKAEPTLAPYMLDEEATKKGELLVLKRVENWWAREYPYFKNQFNFDRLEFKVIPGGSEIVAGHFYNGEIDQYVSFVPAEWRKAAQEPNVTNGYIDRWQVNFVPEVGISGMVLNTKTPFFSNKKTRQAMYYAIDMQGMIDRTLYGEFKRYHNIGKGHYWNGVFFDDNTIEKPDFDPAKAKELLAEAGYTTVGSDGILVNDKGDRASFELLFNRPHFTERLTVLKEQAKKAGVEIELKLQTSGMFNDILNRKHQAAWLTMSTASPPRYWEYFSKSNAEKPITNNFFAWWSPEMEELIAVEESGPSLQMLAETHKKVQRLVHEEALIIPNYYTDFSRALAWKWVRFPAWGNFKYLSEYQWGFPEAFGFMWIDEDIKAEVQKAMKDGTVYEPKVYSLAERYVSK